MNVSIKTSCFRSKTPESSCRQSRPDRFSAFRGWMRSCTCTGLQVRQFWVFCESVPRQILLLRLPVLPEAAMGTQVLQPSWQKIRSVPHFLQPPAIDKKPESNAEMYVNQRRDEMARTWKHILRHDHFRAKYRYRGVFFRTPFSTTFRWRIFSNQRESISRCPKGPFPSKTQNRQIARTSPLTYENYVLHSFFPSSYSSFFFCLLLPDSNTAFRRWVVQTSVPKANHNSWFRSFWSALSWYPANVCFSHDQERPLYQNEGRVCVPSLLGQPRGGCRLWFTMATPLTRSFGCTWSVGFLRLLKVFAIELLRSHLAAAIKAGPPWGYSSHLWS